MNRPIAAALLPLLAGTSAVLAQVAPDVASPPERDGVRGIARFFRDGFPFFDSRRDPATDRPLNPVDVAPGRADSVLSQVASVRIDFHDLLGTPDYVRSTEEFLTAPAKDAPRSVVRGFVDAHPALFGFGGGELDRARVTREYSTAQTGVTHLTWRQEIDGVEIFEARLNANVMPDGRLINIGSTMLPRPAEGFDIRPAVLGPEAAIARAAANVAIRIKGAPARIPEKTGPDGRVFWEVEGTRK
ncbi:MAG: hypothetical protein ACOYN0_11515, partial [Phycisphaerales bacterium]